MYHVWDIESLSFDTFKEKFPEFAHEDEGHAKANALAFFHSKDQLDTKANVEALLVFCRNRYELRYGIVDGQPRFRTYFDWFVSYTRAIDSIDEIRYYLKHLSNAELCADKVNMFTDEYVITEMVARITESKLTIAEVTQDLTEPYYLRQLFGSLIKETLLERKLDIFIFELGRIANEYTDFQISTDDVLLYGINTERDVFKEEYLAMKPKSIFALLISGGEQWLLGVVRYLNDIQYDLTKLVLARDKYIVKYWVPASTATGTHAKLIVHIFVTLLPFADTVLLKEKLRSQLFRRVLDDYSSQV